MMAWEVLGLGVGMLMSELGLGVRHDGLGGDAVHELGAAAHAWEARVLVVLVHLEWLGLGLRVGLGFSLFSST